MQNEYLSEEEVIKLLRITKEEFLNITTGKDKKLFGIRSGLLIVYRASDVDKLKKDLSYDDEIKLEPLDDTNVSDPNKTGTIIPIDDTGTHTEFDVNPEDTVYPGDDFPEIPRPIGPEVFPQEPAIPGNIDITPEIDNLKPVQQQEPVCVEAKNFHPVLNALIIFALVIAVCLIVWIFKTK